MAGDFEIVLIRAPASLKVADLEHLNVETLGKKDSREVEINDTAYSLSTPMMRDASDLVSLHLYAPQEFPPVASAKVATNLSKRVIDRYYALTPTFNVPTEQDFIKAAKDALKVPVTTPKQPEELKQRWVPFGVAPSEIPAAESSSPKKQIQSPESSKEAKKRKSSETPKEKKKSKKNKV